MARATRPLKAATAEAVRANPGYRAVSAMPGLKEGRPHPHYAPGPVSHHPGRSRHPTLSKTKRPNAFLAIQPGGGESPAVVVAEIGTIVLQRGIPHGQGDDRVRLRPVDLLSQVALDLVDELSTLGEVPHPALTKDEIGERWVIDLQDVARALGQIGGGEEAVGLEKRGGRPIDHPLVLTQHRGGDIRAVLLLVEPGVDPHVLEILDDELYTIHQSGLTEAVE